MIMDNITFFTVILVLLLMYFKCMLEVLLHHCAALKLKKCTFLGDCQEFVGIDLLHNGNALAKSKEAAFAAFIHPRMFNDL